MVLLRVNGIIQNVILLVAVVLWIPVVIVVLTETRYFVGFVPLGTVLWLGRSRFYRPRKPAPLSSASGGTTATASGVSAATDQVPSSEMGQADEKEFQPASAVVGFLLLLLQTFASTYWYMKAPKVPDPSNPSFLQIVGIEASLLGTMFIAAAFFGE